MLQSSLVDGAKINTNGDIGALYHNNMILINLIEQIQKSELKTFKTITNNNNNNIKTFIINDNKNTTKQLYPK